MCDFSKPLSVPFLFCASGKSHSQAGSASVALCEFSGWKSCWHKILSQSFQLRPKWHRLNPFFIPPLSPVKSIRISFCISTCRSQYLLPSTIVFQSGKYYIFTHFVCVLLHKLYFWMQIVWFVENNSGKCSNAIWDNARDCWEAFDLGSEICSQFPRLFSI